MTTASALLASDRHCLNCDGDMTGKKASALTCSVACNHARLAERRKAEKWADVVAERGCAQCGTSMADKRPHAKFCSRKCKSAASGARLRDSGESRERDRARYAVEAEHRRAYAKRYQAENPERMRAIRLKRRGRIRAASFAFTELDWARLLRRYGYACAYCGVRRDDLQREHVVPLARGGSHGIGNIVPACPPCNYAKKDKLLIEWRTNSPRGGR